MVWVNRNQQLFADYLGGMSRTQVASKYSLTVHGVNALLVRHGVTLSEDERARRWRNNPPPRNGGRPRVWPECPPELEREYEALARLVGKPAARKELERKPDRAAGLAVHVRNNPALRPSSGEFQPLGQAA